VYYPGSYCHSPRDDNNNQEEACIQKTVTHIWRNVQQKITNHHHTGIIIALPGEYAPPIAVDRHDYRKILNLQLQKGFRSQLGKC